MGNIEPTVGSDSFTEKQQISEMIFLNMRKGGLEPPRGNPHYHLKVARLPIPPLSRDAIRKIKVPWYFFSPISAREK